MTTTIYADEIASVLADLREAGGTVTFTRGAGQLPGDDYDPLTDAFFHATSGIVASISVTGQAELTFDAAAVIDAILESVAIGELTFEGTAATAGHVSSSTSGVLTFDGAAAIVAAVASTGSATLTFSGTSAVQSALGSSSVGVMTFTGSAASVGGVSGASTGTQTMSGDAASSANMASVTAGLVDQIVTDLVALGLTPLGVYDWRYKNRLGSGGALVAWDDRGCLTDVGRCAFPGLDSEVASCGNYTGLNAAATASFLLRAVVPGAATTQTLCSRWGTASTTRQFRILINASRQIRIEVQSGGTTYAWVGTHVFSAGELFDWLPIYNGAAGTDATKFAVQYRVFDPITQTWGAWTADANSAVTAGFLSAMLSVTTENFVFGRDRNGSSGANGYRGLIDDVKVLPGTMLSNAQRDAWAANNTGSADWVAPTIWHDFAALTNRGSTGAANDVTLTSGLALVTDDTTAGRTVIFGPSSARPTVSSGILFDGVDDWGRASGGIMQRLTQDGALVLVGVSPQTGDAFASLSVGPSTNVIKMRRNLTNIEATAAAATPVTTPNGTGTRVWMARRTGAGAGSTVGLKQGTTAEVTGTVTLAAATAARFTMGADNADTPANNGDLLLECAIPVSGNFAGLQSVFTTSWAPVFFSATV